MELTELAQARLLTLAVVAVIAALWLGGRHVHRRNRARVTKLAQALGAETVHGPGDGSTFTTQIGEREAAVQWRSFSRSPSGGGVRGWRLVTDLPLDVSELFSAEVRPRRRRLLRDSAHPDFDRCFEIRDFGYPLPAGWCDERVRSAILAFYRLELASDSLSLEEGRLVHRALLPLRRFRPDTLRELLRRQADLATALERVL